MEGTRPLRGGVPSIFIGFVPSNPIEFVPSIGYF